MAREYRHERLAVILAWFGRSYDQFPPPGDRTPYPDAAMGMAPGGDYTQRVHKLPNGSQERWLMYQEPDGKKHVLGRIPNLKR